ncbi:hypothetical protein GJ496_001123 [Pomphorhynchus laevis]|nr:hypothetical protein GJ496_001123 [Pomphorhynchus laevis]
MFNDCRSLWPFRNSSHEFSKSGTDDLYADDVFNRYKSLAKDISEIAIRLFDQLYLQKYYIVRNDQLMFDPMTTLPSRCRSTIQMDISESIKHDYEIDVFTTLLSIHDLCCLSKSILRTLATDAVLHPDRRVKWSPDFTKTDKITIIIQKNITILTKLVQDKREFLSRVQVDKFRQLISLLTVFLHDETLLTNEIKQGRRLLSVKTSRELLVYMKHMIYNVGSIIPFTDSIRRAN